MKKLSIAMILASLLLSPLARAEGAFGGFFGWPNFTAKLERDFMGIPADGKSAEFRVIDIYRQSGGKLSENWIFIDMPHFAKQHGVQLIPDETLE